VTGITKQGETMSGILIDIETQTVVKNNKLYEIEVRMAESLKGFNNG